MDCMENKSMGEIVVNGELFEERIEGLLREVQQQILNTGECATKTKLRELRKALRDLREELPGQSVEKGNVYRLNKTSKKSLEFLDEVYNDPNVKMETRVKAASAALPYQYHRKPQQVDFTGEIGVHGVFSDMIRAIGISDLEGQIVDEHAVKELEYLELDKDE